MYQFPNYFVRDCLSFYVKLVQKREIEIWLKNCYLHRNFGFLVTKTVMYDKIGVQELRKINFSQSQV